MKPMKPSTIEDFSKLRFPLLGSPKLDGFRARLDGGTAMTSNWKPIVNQHIQDVMGVVALHGLDGEITVGKSSGPGVLQRTSSGVTSVDGTPDFTFHVFDTWAHPELPFKERLRLATAQAKSFPRVFRPVKHIPIKDMAAMVIFNAWCIANGYEGAMYRDPDGPYKFGRATEREGYLLRYKPFKDSEARIEGWYEEEANTNEAKEDELGRMRRSSAKAGKVGKGTLGGFIGTDIHDGKPVRIGIGFTEKQRREFWAMGLDAFMGRLIKYKKQLAGEADKPRHQVFLDFRDIADL